MKTNAKSVLNFENPKTNDHGALYEPGRPFGRLKWFEVLEHYYAMLRTQDEVSIHQLARLARISYKSARKAKEMAQSGHIFPIQQGHGWVRPGSRTRIAQIEHHRNIYDLYLSNPKLPADTYIFFFYRKYGFLLCRQTITHWFKTIGPYKGTMPVTSKFPPLKYTSHNDKLLQDCVSFMTGVDNHTRCVFANEKPLKEVDLTGEVRRDPFTGDIPHETCNANAKNRYNVLAAVTLKPGIALVQALVLEAYSTAALFSNLGLICLPLVHHKVETSLLLTIAPSISWVIVNLSRKVSWTNQVCS